MQRSTFLTIVGSVGLLIGLVALGLPAVILAGKGLPPDPAPAVWVREVGVLIVALSAMVLLVRRQPDSPTMRAILWGNAIVHAGLLPIEIFAWRGGVITRLDGVVPNSVLHLMFVVGFVFFAQKIAAPAA